MKVSFPLGYLSVDGRIILDLKKTGYEGLNWTKLAQVRLQWRAFVNTVMMPRVP